VASSVSSYGHRSVMHKNDPVLAVVLNIIKRLLEQHTLKYQPFIQEDELLVVGIL
jgi:hypothetical protein